ncbi:MAG: hypothetical protein HQM16_16675 [Deltaproteobacteria bacterium]|nr:hypothetical protein [Deltaproteobacteria bacterium]
MTKTMKKTSVVKLKAEWTKKKKKAAPAQTVKQKTTSKKRVARIFRKVFVKTVSAVYKSKKKKHLGAYVKDLSFKPKIQFSKKNPPPKSGSKVTTSSAKNYKSNDAAGSANADRAYAVAAGNGDYVVAVGWNGDVGYALTGSPDGRVDGMVIVGDEATWVYTDDDENGELVAENDGTTPETPDTPAGDSEVDQQLQTAYDNLTPEQQHLEDITQVSNLSASEASSLIDGLSASGASFEVKDGGDKVGIFIYDANGNLISQLIIFLTDWYE